MQTRDLVVGVVVATMVHEAPPPTGPKKPEMQPGPGRGQVSSEAVVPETPKIKSDKKHMKQKEIPRKSPS